MSEFFNFLKKSYPFTDDLKQNTKLIFVISLVIFMVLYFFQPFDLKSISTEDKYFLIGGLIVVVFLALSVNLLLMPAFLSQTSLFKNWNVLKEILWNIWIMFTIVIGYYIYFRLTGSFYFSFFVLIKVLIISAIPVSISIPYNRNRLLRKHLHSALELSRYLENKSNPKPKIVHLKSDYEKDDLSIDVETLLFIRSANNYIEVFWEEENGTKSRMVRCTLLHAEKTFGNFPYIFKCHRTYIVNINQVSRVEGSSQGYILYVGSDHNKVMVSRTYIPRFKELFYKI